eukprot:TRINITY_DN23129_c0_g1_i1.p2 TRINITY_DN23129_c0_g1~~TRINITY_DN23129_c0_g1_i1.p2  ORF type:complete len:269 (-),score=-5.72 TRINITY_DN23129_c0_g1_i1:420-1226(-)
MAVPEIECRVRRWRIDDRLASSAFASACAGFEQGPDRAVLRQQLLRAETDGAFGGGRAAEHGDAGGGFGLGREGGGNGLHPEAHRGAVEQQADRRPILYQRGDRAGGAAAAFGPGEHVERVAAGDECGLGLGLTGGGGQGTGGGGELGDIGAFADEGFGDGVEPVAGVGLDAMGAGFTGEAGVVAVDGAERVDRIGQVAGGRGRGDEIGEVGVGDAAVGLAQLGHHVPCTRVPARLCRVQHDTPEMFEAARPSDATRLLSARYLYRTA